MRGMTHGIYIVAIIAASTVTYLVASSENQPKGYPSTSQPVDNSIVASHPDVVETGTQTSNKSVTENITHQPAALNQESNYALDDAYARIDALEAELAEYRQLRSRLRELPQQLSPERAEARRSQGRDHEWATSTELDLETLFIRDERLRHVQIEQMDCYREHCELTLNHPDLADGFPTQHFTALLKGEERFNTDNFNVMTIGNRESTQLILSKGESTDD